MEGTNSIKRVVRPEKEKALDCPRCNSTNTKFCYYNNYNLSQPRYFCKTCRRYWTQGGSLRNVPVGGGTRKNKRSSFSSKKLFNTNKSTDDLVIAQQQEQQQQSFLQNPNNKLIINHGQDLNLAYNPLSLSQFVEQVPYNGGDTKTQNPNFSFMQINPHVMDQDNTTKYANGFSNLQDQFRPTLSFCLDGFENGYQGVQENGAKLLFPVNDQDAKPTSEYGEMDQNRDPHHQGDCSASLGYWSGMLSGGSW